MAVVRDGMIAGMLSRAGLFADRSLRATRNGWIDDVGTTLAIELLERTPVTGQTSALVACLIALVFAARQIVIARQRTHVIDVNATFLIAFVFAAVALLRATFLAARIIRSRRQQGAFDHLVHMPASALHARLLIARRTRTGVAFVLAHMRVARLATSQSFLAHAGAQWDWIFATFTLVQSHRGFAAWARGHNRRQELAFTTIARMTNLLAFVILAVQVLVADATARILRGLVVLPGASHLLFVTATEAHMLHLLVAAITRSLVAFLRTAMHRTTELFIAHLIAFQIVLLAALHHLLGATTTTLPGDSCLARRTWT